MQPEWTELFGTCEVINDMTEENEKWMAVECCPSYEISNLGRLRRGGREIKGYRLRNGYIGCSVSANGKRRSTTVHALVAEAFLAPDASRSEVNHKNGIKDDNRATNLEWVTHSENIRHSYDVLGNKGRPKRKRPVVEDGPICTITVTTRTEGDCIMEVHPGNRPGNLRVLVNGKHEPKLATTTKLMAWLRGKFPRTSAKRMTE